MSAQLMLKEAADTLKATQDEMTALYEKKKGDDGRPKFEPEEREKFFQLNEAAGKQAEELKKWQKASGEEAERKGLLDDLLRPTTPAPFSADRNDNRDRQPEKKSVGAMALESPAYKRFIDHDFNTPARIELPNYGIADFKTTMTSAAGYSPFVNRTSDIVPTPLRRVMVQDLMPSFQIQDRGLEYMEETTYTALAGPVAEGAIKPESARAFSPRTVIAEVIATTLPITEQQMADAPFLMGYINASLGIEIELAEEAQLLTGTGTSPQLQGITTKPGILTQALGTDTALDAFLRAVTKIQTTAFTFPTAAVWHPSNWQTVLLAKDTQGNYLFGNPAMMGGGVTQVWGVTPVVTPAITLGTALVGDFRTGAYIVRRMGLRIDIGFVNDNFAKNIRTIRAEVRVGQAIRRAANFCSITGLL